MLCDVQRVTCDVQQVTCDTRFRTQTHLGLDTASAQVGGMHVTCHASYVMRHMSHVTRHTSHVTRSEDGDWMAHEKQVHTMLQVTAHTSHVTRHTSHFKRHTSQITRHLSHVTRHTSGWPCQNALLAAHARALMSLQDKCLSSSSSSSTSTSTSNNAHCLTAFSIAFNVIV